MSATAVGHAAAGDGSSFAALSATLALVTAAVLAAAGVLRLGGVTDLISKPVLTGFLFGLGVSVAVGQLPKLLGVEGGSGNACSASSGTCSASSATSSDGRSRWGR